MANRKQRRAAKANGKLKLKIEDLRWYENLVLKEQLVRKQAQEALQAVALEAEKLMTELSKREGKDLRLYNIDWKTGECTPKELSNVEPIQGGS